MRANTRKGKHGLQGGPRATFVERSLLPLCDGLPFEGSTRGMSDPGIVAAQMWPRVLNYFVRLASGQQ